jgi:hypothetical protein
MESRPSGMKACRTGRQDPAFRGPVAVPSRSMSGQDPGGVSSGTSPSCSVHRPCDLVVIDARRRSGFRFRASDVGRGEVFSCRGEVGSWLPESRALRASLTVVQGEKVFLRSRFPWLMEGQGSIGDRSRVLPGRGVFTVPRVPSFRCVCNLKTGWKNGNGSFLQCFMVGLHDGRPCRQAPLRSTTEGQARLTASVGSLPNGRATVSPCLHRCWPRNANFHAPPVRRVEGDKYAMRLCQRPMGQGVRPDGTLPRRRPRHVAASCGSARRQARFPQQQPFASCPLPAWVDGASLHDHITRSLFLGAPDAQSHEGAAAVTGNHDPGGQPQRHGPSVPSHFPCQPPRTFFPGRGPPRSIPGPPPGWFLPKAPWQAEGSGLPPPVRPQGLFR